MDDETKFGVKKNWKRAKGIVTSRGETNSAFAERNYKVKCNTTGGVIAVVGGYHTWWCNLHHQPLAWCDKARAIEHARASEREKNLESAKRQMDLLVIEMTKKHPDALEEARKQKCQLCQKYKASICVHCHNTEWDEDE